MSILDKAKRYRMAIQDGVVQMVESAAMGTYLRANDPVLAAMERVCEVVLAGPRKSLSTVDYATEQGENETEYYAQLEHARSALRAIREARG